MQTGAPSASLTAAQITDLSHFIWQRINDTLQGSPAYDVKNVLTGDPEGRAGVLHRRRPVRHLPLAHRRPGRLRPPIQPGRHPAAVRVSRPPRARPRRRRGARKPVTVTVTAPGSEPVSGVLVSLDDFHVALRDGDGEYRSFTRTPDMTVVKNDPFAATWSCSTG